MVLTATLLVSLHAHYSLNAGNGRGAYRPLDLPSGGLGDNADDGEPLCIVHLYGTQVEGDAFIWCLDRSESMETGEHLDVMKLEVQNAIASLSPYSQLAVVAFSNKAGTWTTHPKTAKAANKALASSWIEGLTAEGRTCFLTGMKKAFEMAGLCTKPQKTIILISDGLPQCDRDSSFEEELEVAKQINAWNSQRIPVHCIGVGGYDEGRELLRRIAAASAGRLTVVNVDPASGETPRESWIDAPPPVRGSG